MNSVLKTQLFPNHYLIKNLIINMLLNIINNIVIFYCAYHNFSLKSTMSIHLKISKTHICHLLQLAHSMSFLYF